MYVIKVGNYYVKSVSFSGDFITGFVLSNEIMRGYQEPTANKLASLINGEVIKMADEVTNE